MYMNKGKLYVVATPIGNLGDITLRALEVLKGVAFVLAEDTRESSKLLRKYEIPTQLVSYRDQNHIRMLDKIVEKLDIGLDLALISDCGTPLISDPGYKLVRYLRENKYEVVSIPGPSALTSALSISGLPTDRFTFLGFLPKSDSKRVDILKAFDGIVTTLALYESPKRILKLLNQLGEVFGDVNVFLAKDISKMREYSYFGSISEIVKELGDEEIFGEFVCIVNTGKPN